MEGFLEFLSNNELTIVICLMVVIFGLIMTILIIDIYSRRVNQTTVKDDMYDDELDRTNIDVNTSGLGTVADVTALDSIDVENVTKNLEKTQEIEEIKYVEEDEDLEKTKALLELESIKQELSKIENQEYLDVEPEVTFEVVEDSTNIETSVVEQSNDLPVEEPKTESTNVAPMEEVKVSTIEDEVEKFESDQEENAIISVEELQRASQNITDEEIEAYEDDGNEPISIMELEALYKSMEDPTQEVKVEPVTSQEEKITLPDFDIKVKPAVEVYEDKNFKNTPVISPVFGVKQTESSISLEHTANLDKLNDEIKKTNEFLSMLKELRKNLD